MTILNRPLFRQAGGPIQPEPMMAPPMDPAMDPMMQAVGDAEMQGAQVGEQYMADTMQNLDMAESPKEVIDAIRGNARPLEARYQELATFVGEEDALQTPESVLAMVQPTIMMSEEGAMDTGIAELMQGMMGDVEMAPGSEMAEGVGSLMMAGASEAPAPQNFNQGGAVAHLALGSDESGTVPAGLAALQGDKAGILQALMAAAQPPKAETVKSYYESLLPVYRNVIGDPEEARRARQSDAYLRLAEMGLNLASGTDPRTGRSTAGMPIASQIASSASLLPSQLAELGAEQRADDRSLRTAALQTALQQAQGSQDYLQQLNLAAAKEMFDTSDPKTAQLEYLYKDGEVLTFDRTLGSDVATQVQTKLDEGWSPVSPSETGGLGGSRIARAYTLLSDPENLIALERHFGGDTSEESNLAASAYSILVTPERDPITGFVSTAILPDSIQQAVARGKSQGTGEVPDTATNVPVEDIPTTEEQPLTSEVDMELATGLPSGPAALGAFLISNAADVFNVPYRPDQADSTRASRRALGMLNLEIEQFILDDQGRPLSNEFATIQQMLAQPNMFQDDEDAFRKIVSLRDHVANQKRIGETIVSRAKEEGGFTGAEVNNQNVRIIKAEQVLKILDGAIASYDRAYGEQSGAAPRVDVSDDLVDMVRRRQVPVPKIQ